MTGCYYDNVEELSAARDLLQPCDTAGTISFASDIQPIMNQSCGGNNSCHGPGSVNNNNVFLYDHAGVYAQTLNDNPLMSSITHDGNYNEMPKGGGKLNDCSINTIAAWINRGAPNN